MTKNEKCPFLDRLRTAYDSDASSPYREVTWFPLDGATSEPFLEVAAFHPELGQWMLRLTGLDPKRSDLTVSQELPDESGYGSGIGVAVSYPLPLPTTAIAASSSLLPMKPLPGHHLWTAALIIATAPLDFTGVTYDKDSGLFDVSGEGLTIRAASDMGVVAVHGSGLLLTR